MCVRREREGVRGHASKGGGRGDVKIHPTRHPTHNWCTQSCDALYLALQAHSMEKLRPLAQALKSPMSAVQRSSAISVIL